MANVRNNPPVLALPVFNLNTYCPGSPLVSKFAIHSLVNGEYAD